MRKAGSLVREPVPLFERDVAAPVTDFDISL